MTWNVDGAMHDKGLKFHECKEKFSGIGSLIGIKKNVLCGEMQLLR